LRSNPPLALQALHVGIDVVLVLVTVIGGTMIVAVMTRASLGHTGRALVVDPLITLAYLLLTGAASIRVFGLSALGLNYPSVIALAALCWTTAFLLFVGVYAPILCRPRIDGKAG